MQICLWPSRSLHSVPAYLQAVTRRKEGIQKFWQVSPSMFGKNCPSLCPSYKPLGKWCLCWGSSWLPFPRRKGCVPRSMAGQGWKPPSETSFIIAEGSNKGHTHVTGSPECRGIAGGGESSARALLTHLSPREETTRQRGLSDSCMPCMYISKIQHLCLSWGIK